MAPRIPARGFRKHHLVTLLHRIVHRSLAGIVLDLHVSTVFKQQVDDGLVAAIGCEHQGCPACIVLDIRVCLPRKECSYRLDLLPPGSRINGGLRHAMPISS